MTDRIDKLVEAMMEDSALRGMDITRTQVLKMLVRLALPIAEMEFAGGISGKTKEEEFEYLRGEFFRFFGFLRDRPPDPLEEERLLQMIEVLPGDTIDKIVEGMLGDEDEKKQPGS